ncbi:hypothetical protein [Advenella sp. S44]|uniref:hypothetical protein n=1 Tax=Advenella sp. S44 TaxID=1982755 RepID=UPI00128FF44B|nr:hypothetical protein [Advenella sp. S44]
MKDNMFLPSFHETRRHKLFFENTCIESCVGVERRSFVVDLCDAFRLRLLRYTPAMHACDLPASQCRAQTVDLKHFCSQ